MMLNRGLRFFPPLAALLLLLLLPPPVEAPFVGCFEENIPEPPFDELHHGALCVTGLWDGGAQPVPAKNTPTG